MFCMQIKWKNKFEMYGFLRDTKQKVRLISYIFSSTYIALTDEVLQAKAESFIQSYNNGASEDLVKS